MNPLPQDPKTRNNLATAVGAVFVVGGGFLLYQGLFSEYVAAGFMVAGAYLMLPRRMRLLGEWVVDKYKEVRGKS